MKRYVLPVIITVMLAFTDMDNEAARSLSRHFYLHPDPSGVHIFDAQTGKNLTLSFSGQQMLKQ
ncbi:hypothetical protein M1N04_00320 [Peptococcaceae bacterium]|nr:hypothetical protein [Peptococcaceae bacterium]